MNISKLGAFWSLLTGGWAGLATYILEVINKWLATLDQTKLAEASKIVTAVSSAVKVLLDTFLPAKFKKPAEATISALNELAAALSDGKLDKDELDKQIDLIEVCIAAWKEVK